MSEEPARIGLADIADVVSTRTDGQLPLVFGSLSMPLGSTRCCGPTNSLSAKTLIFTVLEKFWMTSRKKYQVPIKLSPPRFPGIDQIVIPKMPRSQRPDNNNLQDNHRRHAKRWNQKSDA
jgi:hypothetical protein